MLDAAIVLDELGKFELEFSSTSKQFDDIIYLSIRGRYDRVCISRHAIYDEQQFHLECTLEVRKRLRKIFQFFLP